ncbi:PadR family transcriptional regulator [Algisphaera agarilytica]|uniref:DNA-binding PadR family transcriptional regulator n=1 Tax=Algisphaera agarilytica TaxID=1385975 RepID=A0A7X0H5K7_9BACT|nr:PadR family transcriptional regulator [Algisphaera agarilytica]MBB6429702.1 DNA-binding PadR family transcriptional regulator [Algisphaera agarilytica]
MPETAPRYRRDLFRASLEVLVLSVLADRPAHGYAIQKQLQLTTGQPLPYGTLYPLLHRLAEQGLIHAEAATVGGRARKRYRVTDVGREQYRAYAADWQAMLAQMQSVVLPSLRRIARPTLPV